MIRNNIKALIIHFLICLSAYYYTQVSFNRYLIVLLGSTFLYYLWGGYFLNPLKSTGDSLKSVAVIPALGLIIWFITWVQLGYPSDVHHEYWLVYSMYTGYMTPLIRKRITCTGVLPLFSLMPSLLIYMGFMLKGRPLPPGENPTHG